MKKFKENSHIILTVILLLTFIIVYPFTGAKIQNGAYVDTNGMLLVLIMFDLPILIVFYNSVFPFSKKSYNCLVILFIISVALLPFLNIISLFINMAVVMFSMLVIFPKYANRKK